MHDGSLTYAHADDSWEEYYRQPARLRDDAAGARQGGFMFSKAARLLPLLCVSLCAQEYRATLSGKVTDPSGAAVADAAVTAKAPATGVVQNTVTSGDGTYQIPFLTPGAYVLTVEKTGFKQAIREALPL